MKFLAIQAEELENIFQNENVFWCKIIFDQFILDVEIEIRRPLM